jgi:hypothetical protein
MVKLDQPKMPPSDNRMKIRVSKNGPILVEGGLPLIKEEICNDDEGYCRKWKEVTR